MLPCTVSILSLKMERNRFVRTPETSDNPKTRTETENWPLLAGRGLPHKLCRSVHRFFRVNPAHLGRLCGPNSSPPNLWRLGRLARWAFSASSWIGPAAGVASLAIWDAACCQVHQPARRTPEPRGQVAVARAPLVGFSLERSGLRGPGPC